MRKSDFCLGREPSETTSKEGEKLGQRDRKNGRIRKGLGSSNARISSSKRTKANASSKKNQESVSRCTIGLNFAMKNRYALGKRENSDKHDFDTRGSLSKYC